MTTSLEELELRGYEVRCGTSSWRGLRFRDAVYTEVEMLSHSDGDACRVQCVVADLAPETLYVVEARSRSSRGSSEWCRLGSDPIRTAMVAESPPAPELVYSMPPSHPNGTIT